MKTTDFEVRGSLPPLPPIVTTHDGVAFDPRTNLWKIGGLTRSGTFRFADFGCLAPQVVASVKWMLLTYLQEKSFSHADNLYTNFRLFYRTALANVETALEQISLAEILSFKGTLSVQTEWKLGALRILLVDMHRLGFGIATDEAIAYLGTSTIRGNIKGTSIRTRDPQKGAFSDSELMSIQSALNDAYAKGEITLYSFAIAWLFLAYGCRPVQVAALKERDLLVSVSGDVRTYALRIPRAKQRGQSHRDAFNTRYCGKQVGTLLEKVIEHNDPLRRERGLARGDAPMFIGWSAGPLPSLPYHRTSHEIAKEVGDVVGRLTGVKANTKRFRITLAQRAVDDGKDKFTVAELLDHSDTQNVGVYYEASPALVLRLDRHLAMEMAPLAQAFAGVVVETEAEAQRGGDRASRIYDRSITDNVSAALGTCGQMSFCGLAVPFACYTCRHFQPWIDGPHEEFLGALIADRERMQAEEYSPKIFSIRDRTILAVAEVIQLCESQRELRAEANA